MDHVYLYCVVAGIGLVLLFVAAKIAFRWIIRLTIVGLLLLAVVGGAVWWWLGSSSPPRDTKPRPASMSGRSAGERR